MEERRDARWTAAAVSLPTSLFSLPLAPTIQNKEGYRSVWEWEKGLVSVNSNSHRVYGTPESNLTTEP
jgi:hypothetical protein